MSILEEHGLSERAREIHRAQKIKSGISRDLKVAIATLARSTRKHPISAEHLQKLVELKLVEKKFGRLYLTSLGRVVSIL